MQNKVKTSSNHTLFGLVVNLCIIGAVVYGWVANIAKIFQHSIGLDGEIIARAIGVFVFPLGVVLGYF